MPVNVRVRPQGGSYSGFPEGFVHPNRLLEADYLTKTSEGLRCTARMSRAPATKTNEGLRVTP